MFRGPGKDIGGSTSGSGGKGWGFTGKPKYKSRNISPLLDLIDIIFRIYESEGLPVKWPWVTTGSGRMGWEFTGKPKFKTRNISLPNEWVDTILHI